MRDDLLDVLCQTSWHGYGQIMTDDSLLLVADLHWGGFINQWGEKKQCNGTD